MLFFIVGEHYIFSIKAGNNHLTISLPQHGQHSFHRKLIIPRVPESLVVISRSMPFKSLKVFNALNAPLNVL